MKMRVNSLYLNIGRAPCAPFDFRKCIAAEVGAALVTGGASVLSNLFGLGSQKSANDANMEIAKYNAAMQKQQNEANWWYQKNLLQDQRDYETKMYYENRDYNEAYNDPSAVVQRLKAAGINPATAFGSPTPASSVQPSAPSVPSYNGVAPQLNTQVQPFRFDFSGIASAGNAYFQNKLLSEQTKEKAYDAQIRGVEAAFKARQIISDLLEQSSRIELNLQNVKKGSAEYDKLQSEKEQVDLEIKFFKESYQTMIERERKQNDVLDAQREDLVASVSLKRAQATLASVNAFWANKLNPQQLENMKAEENNLILSAANLIEEGKLTSAKKVSQYLQNGLQSFDFLREGQFQKELNSSKYLRVLYYSCDFLGRSLFSNLKLFPKM